MGRKGPAVVSSTVFLHKEDRILGRRNGPSVWQGALRRFLFGGPLVLSLFFLGAGAGTNGIAGAAQASTHAGGTNSTKTGAGLRNYEWLYKPLVFENHVGLSGDFTISAAGEANCVGAVTSGKFALPAGGVTKDVGAQINSNFPCNHEASTQRFQVHVGLSAGQTVYASFYIRLDQAAAGAPYHLSVAQRVTEISMPGVGILKLSNRSFGTQGVLAQFFRK